MWELILSRREDWLLYRVGNLLRGLIPLQWKRESETNSQFCCQLSHLGFLPVWGFVSNVFLLVQVLEVTCNMKVVKLCCTDLLFYNKNRNAVYLKPVDKALRNWPLQ